MLTAVQTLIYPLSNTLETNGPRLSGGPLFLAIFVRIRVLRGLNVCVLEQTTEFRPSSLTWSALSDPSQGI